MDQTKQSRPANRSQQKRHRSVQRAPRLRRSAAVREYITRMVAGMNNYKAKE